MTSGPQRSGISFGLDALLEDAEVLQDVTTAGLHPYLPDAGTDGAEAAPGCQHHRPPPTDAPPGAAREPVCVSACARTIRETAARDLHLAVSLVLGDPRAAAALTRFAQSTTPHTEGAVVFGALLHLTGHREAAQFWWQYAAGGESHTAAFCLYLHHRHLGQHRTAQHWRNQARLLQTPGCPRTPRRQPGGLSLLPTRVHHALLRQCYQGTPPHLPPAMEEALNILYRGGQDQDDGTVYSPPAHTLPTHLAHAASC
ncbi:hypothetical protein OG552_01940 [Streptomyces sp. NBC_01476]|uniref:hypothetical protein n=1 Tax=Streptomyces sp. NBC_01476 TaxID=2903881 RepID=UPI002E3370A8|nr:hypothetical protein [Streptomyces sp. NBC_01476]